METTETCSICGEDDDFSIKHTMSCGHTFHYHCLFQTFKNMRTNRCPYCRSGNHFLPLVNGVKKIEPYIHKVDQSFVNYKCQAIISRGPNKGKMCGKHCHIGYNYCKTHLKQEAKTEKQLKNIVV